MPRKSKQIRTRSTRNQLKAYIEQLEYQAKLLIECVDIKEKYSKFHG